MSIFSAIKNAIFGSPAAASASNPDARAEASITASATGAAPDVSAASTGAAVAAAAEAAKAAAAGAAKPAKANVDVAAILDRLDEESDLDDIDWRKSIVDLMKLLKLDSSLKARKALATELGYTGDMGDSAKMNVWLHKQVMTKLAENGGVVPAELRD